MNIQSIHHIAILTDDYATSKRFYTEVLGFEVIRETSRWNCMRNSLLRIE